VANFARSLADNAAASDGLSRAGVQARGLGDGAAASDELLPYDLAAVTWITGPLIDPWVIGPLESLAT
jgi:hypothetical protein